MFLVTLWTLFCAFKGIGSRLEFQCSPKGSFGDARLRDHAQRGGERVDPLGSKKLLTTLLLTLTSYKEARLHDWKCGLMQTCKLERIQGTGCCKIEATLPAA